MAFSGTGKVWMNGKLVDWANATMHVAAHVIHYGSGVFEGARCYSTPKGSACFRLDAHIRRLYDSARIYRIEYAVGQDDMTTAVLDTIKANGLPACYIRPLIYRGYNTLGVNPLPCPVDGLILVWEWGAYLGADALENGVDVRVSSWTRSAPNTFPAMAKSVANYANFLADEVTRDGKRIGFSLLPVYSSQARAWISLAVIDEDAADSAGEVIVNWGEPDGGSAKPTVERHVQRPIRATIETRAVRRA